MPGTQTPESNGSEKNGDLVLTSTPRICPGGAYACMNAGQSAAYQALYCNLRVLSCPRIFRVPGPGMVSETRVLEHWLLGTFGTGDQTNALQRFSPDTHRPVAPNYLQFSGLNPLITGSDPNNGRYLGPQEALNFLGEFEPLSKRVRLYPV